MAVWVVHLGWTLICLSGLGLTKQDRSGKRVMGLKAGVDSSAAGSHGGRLPELRQKRAAVHRSQIRGHGEREEGSGVPFL